MDEKVSIREVKTDSGIPRIVVGENTTDGFQQPKQYKAGIVLTAQGYNELTQEFGAWGVSSEQEYFTKILSNRELIYQKISGRAVSSSPSKTNWKWLIGIVGGGVVVFLIYRFVKTGKKIIVPTASNVLKKPGFKI